MPPVGGLAVAVDRGDPDDGRVAHRRRAEVEERIVVRPLPLHAAEPESLRRQAACETVGGRAPVPAEALVLLELEPQRSVGRVQLEGRSRNELKCGGSSTAITVPLGACTRSTGSSRFSRAANSTETSPLSRA